MNTTRKCLLTAALLCGVCPMTACESDWWFGDSDGKSKDRGEDAIGSGQELPAFLPIATISIPDGTGRYFQYGMITGMSYPGLVIARYNQDGSLDTTFGNGDARQVRTPRGDDLMLVPSRGWVEIFPRRDRLIEVQALSYVRNLQVAPYLLLELQVGSDPNNTGELHLDVGSGQPRVAPGTLTVL